MLVNTFISIFPSEIKAEKILAFRSNVSEGRIFHILPLQFILNRPNWTPGKNNHDQEHKDIEHDKKKPVRQSIGETKLVRIKNQEENTSKTDDRFCQW